MGRLIDTADINNVFMLEKSDYGMFAVEIDRIISGIVSKCPTIEPKTESVTEFADRCCECGKRYVKRQTGHWIKQILGYKCSNCILCTTEVGRSIYKYCPNCGCKMVDPQESEDKG